MKYLYVMIAFCFPIFGFSVEALPSYPEGRLSEDAQIALLVSASERTVQQLHELQASLAAFRKQEAACIESPDDAEKLYGLSKCALAVLQGIRAAHVEPYFRTAFIEELEAISKPAVRKTIPPIGTP